MSESGNPPPTTTENLNHPSMGSPQPDPEQQHPPHSPATALPEKRKREPDPEAPSDPNPAPTPKHPLWKTSLCSYFRRSESGQCSHGESCRYAHGEEELRPRPDNTWDPTSQRAKKMAKTDNVVSDEKDKEKESGVMMTEALEAEGNGDGGLSKCLVNLPMKWSSDQLRKYLNDKGIVFQSAKKKKGMIVGFVTFENADQVKTAVKELDGQSVGNNRTLKVEDVIPRSFDKKNNVALPTHANWKMEEPSPDSDHLNLAEKDEADDDVPNGSVLKGRSARGVVTPLAHMSYSDQLEHKKNSLAQILKKLTRNARKACPNGISLPEWIMKSREIGSVLTMSESSIQFIYSISRK